MRPEGDVAGGDEASRRFAGYLESAALLDVQDEVKAVERGEFAKRTRPDPFDVEILEKTRRQAQRRLSAGIVPMDPNLERGGGLAPREPGVFDLEPALCADRFSAAEEAAREESGESTRQDEKNHRPAQPLRSPCALLEPVVLVDVRRIFGAAHGAISRFAT